MDNARKFASDVIGFRNKFGRKMVMISPAIRNLGERETVMRLKDLDSFNSQVVGPVRFGEFIQAGVKLPKCVVLSMSFLGATYCKKVRVSAKYQVWLNGHNVRSGQIPSSVMLDNHWWPIDVGRLNVNDGEELVVRVTNLDSSTNIGFYECDKEPDGKAKFGTRTVRPLAMRVDVET